MYKWNTFIYKDDVYIIKSYESPLLYKINVSNIINLWSEELSIEDIVQRCKNLNPLITTDDETYIKVVKSLVENKLTENDVTITKIDNNLQLQYKTTASDVCFKFICNLKLENDFSLCKELTAPLIHTIQYLEKRQIQFCELLKKKDEEIQQHIFENGNIKRESVITQKFDQEDFNRSSSQNLCCNVLSNSDDFNKVLISKYGCAEPDLMTVKKEDRKRCKKNRSIAIQIIKNKRRKFETLKEEN